MARIFAESLGRGLSLSTENVCVFSLEMMQNVQQQDLKPTNGRNLLGSLALERPCIPCTFLATPCTNEARIFAAGGGGEGSALYCYLKW